MALPKETLEMLDAKETIDRLQRERDALMEISKHIIRHWKTIVTGNMPSPMTMLVERLRETVEEIEVKHGSS